MRKKAAAVEAVKEQGTRTGSIPPVCLNLRACLTNVSADPPLQYLNAKAAPVLSCQ